MQSLKTVERLPRMLFSALMLVLLSSALSATPVFNNFSNDNHDVLKGAWIEPMEMFTPTMVGLKRSDTCTYKTARPSPNTSSSEARLPFLRSSLDCSLRCPERNTFNLPEGECSVTITFDIPEVALSCNEQNYEFAHQIYYPLGSGTMVDDGFGEARFDFLPGDSRVVYLLLSEFGDTLSQCEFIVTLVDGTSPELTCRDTLHYLLDGFQTCDTLVDASSWGPDIEDDCPGQSVFTCEIEFPDGTIQEYDDLQALPDVSFPLGRSTITTEYRDASDNGGICTTQVFVQDTLAPEIATCPDDRQITTLPGICEALVPVPALSILNLGCDEESVLQRFRVEPEGPSGNVPNNVTLSVGQYTIYYDLEDAAGNTSACSFNVNIADPAAPTLRECPANRSFTATQNVCQLLDTIQVPGGIEDDCLDAIKVRDSLLRPMKFESSTGNLDSMIYVFSDPGLNAFSEVRLRIEVFGDVDDGSENFALFNEDGNLLFTSPTDDDASCTSPASLTRTLSTDDLDRWLEDGRLQFEVRPTILTSGNPKPDGDPDDQNINDFCSDGSDNDGPRILFILTYSPISDYYYEISGATERNLTRIPRGSTIVDTFQTGVSTVDLIYFDRGGNRGSCSYEVEYLDVIDPVIECKENYSIDVFPFDLDTLSLRPEDFIEFIGDECGLSDTLLIAEDLNCDAIGDLVEVEIFAIDRSGNTSSCQVDLSLNAIDLQPNYNRSICAGDTLLLFPDPRVNDLTQNFTVEWRNGDGDLVSEVLNASLSDIDTSDAGIYTFTVVSEDGNCEASGEVLVEIAEVPERLELDVSVAQACVNQSFRLNATVWDVANVQYEWFLGTPGNGLFLASTFEPFLDWSLPAPGTVQFYVVASNGSCSTNPSTLDEIEIVELPVLDLLRDTADVCSTTELLLETTVSNAQLYEWTGPNGFISSEQNPVVAFTASEALEGWYFLRINNNGCWSNPDSIFIDILPQPDQPELNLNSPVCEGTEVTLSTVASADSFVWIFPDDSEYTTLNSSFTFSTSGISSGSFRLQVQVDGCLSNPSDAVPLEINQVGELELSSNAPLCENEMLQLNAADIPGAEYSWTGPGLNSNMRAPDVPDPLPGMYILNVTAANGCEKSDSVRVVIEQVPDLQGIDVNLDIQDCLTGRDTLIISPLGVPQGQNLSYLWSLPDGTNRNTRNLVFPNATSDLNGTYRLTVSSSSGCSSQERNVILEFSNAPAPPQIVFTDPVCEGEQLVLTCSEVQNNQVMYIWQTPNGTLNTTVPELRIPNVSKLRDEGPYQVLVEIGDCVSAFSQVASVIILDRPDLPSIFGDSTYCEGDQLTLSTDNMADLQYDWSGPGIDGDESELTIEEIDISDAGTYSLRVIDTSTNCASELTQIGIVVFEAPQRPVLTASDPVVCPGDSLRLSVNLQNFDSVQWQNPSGVILSTRVASLNLVDNQIEEGLWRARAFSGQCPSSWSDFFNVQIDQLYSIDIDGETELCTGEPLQLSTSEIQAATYDWIDPDGRIVGNNRSINLTSPQEGTYKLRFTSPLGCRYSDSVDLTVFSSPQIDSIVVAGATCVNGNQEVELVPYVSPGDDPNLNFSWTPVNGLPGLDSIYTITNARSNNSGDYFLEVSDGNNCFTERELINLQLNTIPPLPVVSQSDTICNGDDLLLSTQDFAGNTEIYRWNTPLGQFETDEPQLRLTNMTRSNNGPITVQVITPFCNSDVALDFIPAIKAVPEPPTVTVVPSICAGDTLSLEASRVPGVPEAEARYSWRGPQGFAPGVRQPVIPNIPESRSGYYRVRVQVDGCWSGFSDSVYVQVDSIPSAPMVLPVDDICLDNQFDDIELAIDPRSSRPGATYQFYEAQTDEPLLPFSTGLAINLPIDTLQPGFYSVYARTRLNGCISARSLSETFEVQQIPDTILARIKTDSIIRCGDQPFLEAEQLPDDPNFSGFWRQVGGPNPVDINSETTAFTSINFGQLEPGEVYLFEWSIAYGSCGTFSRDTMYFLNVDADQQAVVRNARIVICNQDFTVLEAFAPTGSVVGRWTQPDQQQSLGVRIVDPDDATTTIEGLELLDNQVYNFIWQLTHPICGVISSAAVEVVVRREDPCQAFAGEDQIICTEPEIDLQAGSSGSCSGFWNTPGDANIVSPGLPQTNVRDLEVGDNVFIWSLENLQCGLFDEDTVVVTYHVAADARDDVFDLEFADIRALDLTANDGHTEDAVLDILRDPQHGRLELGPDSLYYFADLEFLGADSFSYRLCDLRCINYCDTAEVQLSIGGDLGCQIPTLITPNGDGVNDIFLIPCLATGDYPFNRVSIFNQWGDIVFEDAPYKNNWRGTYKGEDLPGGTYYFVVDFGDATPVESGFVIIQR
ncbi:MAG TPA: gliding motility-associated C-terminal domain-containing protein [Saprospiraceae bacterium]|nr:gliding motility-associated C-terminal domain-containing protein [Saprospiraceae bacterium]